jgi:uncharacterized membrane protein
LMSGWDVGQMMGPMWGMGSMTWLWVLLILGVGYWFWWYGPRDYPRRRYDFRDDPLEIARVRLANGEITVEEFDRIKEKILKS